MARIAGINVPDNKHAGVSLTYIYGIGTTTAKRLCESAGVNPEVKVQDLQEVDLDSVQQADVQSEQVRLHLQTRPAAVEPEAHAVQAHVIKAQGV